MINILLETALSLFDSFLCIYFITRFNNASFKKSKFGIPAIIVYFLTTLIGDIVMPHFNMVTTIVLLVISILYAFSVCKKHYVRAIITACIYKMVFILLSSSIFTVLSYFYTDFEQILYGGDSSGRYIYMVIHKVSLFAISTLLTHIFNKDDYLEIRNGVYTLIVSLTTIIGLGATFAIVLYSEYNRFGNHILVITLSFILVNVIVYFLISQVQKLQKNKYELRLLQEKVRFDQERHNDISVMWENIRKVQHDMKQHLTVISCQLADKNLDECKKYVDDLIPSINYTNKLVNTENPVLDYLINAKLSSLKDVTVYVSGMIVDLSDINDLDLSCVIGNVIDNAIEAVENINEKRIELIFDIKNANRIIICKNTIEESVLDFNKDLKSTKSSRNHFGLGCKIIRNIVEKYDGMVDFFEEDGMFGVEIILPVTDHIIENVEI